MIIEFSIGNYRSFNEIQTLNFRATGLVSEDKAVDENNIVEVAGQKLLKTIGVYGANGSGKSNLLRGLGLFKLIITLSLERENLISSMYESNALFSEGDLTFGYFQAIVVIENSKYRYGFALSEENSIDAEWLFGPAEKNETWYFKRNGSIVDVNQNNFPEGENLPDDKLRSNALFLSFCSAYNGNISRKIRDFFNFKCLVDSPWEAGISRTNTLVKEGKREVVLQLFRDAGLIFTDIELRENIKAARDLTIIAEPFVKLYKPQYNSKGGVVGNVMMDLDSNESAGTQKYYQYIGILLHLFENGGLFISDEIDSNFHPALLRKIIGMFNNPVINKANAQLLFTSHDTNLMSPDIMRRDQFYFTEKSATDSTILYSLADLKGIRNNADFAKQYLAGYYGALPMLGNYLEEQANSEQE